MKSLLPLALFTLFLTSCALSTDTIDAEKKKKAEDEEGVIPAPSDTSSEQLTLEFQEAELPDLTPLGDEGKPSKPEPKTSPGTDVVPNLTTDGDYIFENPTNSLQDSSRLKGLSE